VLFFLRTLQQQKRRLVCKVEREKIIMSALPELAVTIIDHARQHGHLVKRGTGNGTWYALPY